MGGAERKGVGVSGGVRWGRQAGKLCISLL